MLDFFGKNWRNKGRRRAVGRAKNSFFIKYFFGFEEFWKFLLYYDKVKYGELQKIKKIMGEKREKLQENTEKTKKV